MSYNVKITNKIDDTHYIIEVLPEKDKDIDCSISAVHDYIRFTGRTHIPSDISITEGCCTSYELDMISSIQIPIRAFTKIALPLLRSTKYTQDEHLKKRDVGKDKVSTAPYSYYDSVKVVFHDNDTKESIIGVLFRGDEEPVLLPLDTYNKIKLK